MSWTRAQETRYRELNQAREDARDAGEVFEDRAEFNSLKAARPADGVLTATATAPRPAGAVLLTSRDARAKSTYATAAELLRATLSDDQRTKLTAVEDAGWDYTRATERNSADDIAAASAAATEARTAFLASLDADQRVLEQRAQEQAQHLDGKRQKAGNLHVLKVAALFAGTALAAHFATAAQAGGGAAVEGAAGADAAIGGAAGDTLAANPFATATAEEIAAVGTVGEGAGAITVTPLQAGSYGVQSSFGHLGTTTVDAFGASTFAPATAAAATGAATAGAGGGGSGGAAAGGAAGTSILDKGIAAVNAVLDNPIVKLAGTVATVLGGATVLNTLNDALSGAGDDAGFDDAPIDTDTTLDDTTTTAGGGDDTDTSGVGGSTSTDTDVATAGALARNRRKRGRAASILTGGLGVLTPGSALPRRASLLGA